MLVGRLRALAEELGPVNVATRGYQHAVADTRAIDYTWSFIESFKSKLFLPVHHDATRHVSVELGLDRLFARIRTERPNSSRRASLTGPSSLAQA